MLPAWFYWLPWNAPRWVSILLVPIVFSWWISGLSRTGQLCCLIWLAPRWNPAVEEQAFDRCHRLGQNKTVYFTRITVSNSVETRIRALQEEKRQLAQAALGEGKLPCSGWRVSLKVVAGEFKLPPAARLSMEDFKKLFTASRSDDYNFDADEE